MYHKHLMSHQVRISVYGETKQKTPRQRKAVPGKLMSSFLDSSASPYHHGAFASGTA